MDFSKQGKAHGQLIKGRLYTWMPLLVCFDVSSLKITEEYKCTSPGNCQGPGCHVRRELFPVYASPASFPRGVWGIGGKRKCREGLLDNGMVLGVFWERGGRD